MTMQRQKNTRTLVFMALCLLSASAIPVLLIAVS